VNLAAEKRALKPVNTLNIVDLIVDLMVNTWVN
jgi:hypothetical protein